MEKIVNRQDIILISTGGTIEKSYDETDGSLSNKESILQNEILKYLRMPYTNIHFFNIINKDSLQFTDEDRDVLLNTIKTQLKNNWPIIILHGTDTMARSAEHCLKALTNLKMPVVFTGAMKPMGFNDSDAFQNVTEAILACKILSPGVFISFHGRVFSVPWVKKNHLLRTFEECEVE